ncbi:MAG TPA: enoyl-CoA hydratase, partial [Clostridiales bacterium]|nr:enoyl-CoA hydratase [Clostridiales bacterium]
MYTEANTVLLNVTEGVAVITLNQPKSMNALSPELQEELFRIIEQVGKDRAVGTVVLTGNGRAFC